MVKQVWHWFSRRQFLSSLILIVVVAVPGYVRQEMAIDDAHGAADDAHDAAVQAQATADALANLVLRFEDDRAERRHELCLRDVNDRVDDRAMWVAGLDLFPESAEAAELRMTLDERLPLLECNAEDIPVPVGGP